MSKVKFKQSEMSPLTEERKLALQALAEKPDSELDYSDLPPLSDAFWKSAVRGQFYKPTKTHASVRIDSDVMFWLKSKGRGYQTRMNEILRKAMADDIEQIHGHS